MNYFTNWKIHSACRDSQDTYQKDQLPLISTSPLNLLSVSHVFKHFSSDLAFLPQEFVLASIFLAFHTPLSCQKSHMHKALSCPNRPNTHAAVLEAGATT